MDPTTALTAMVSTLISATGVIIVATQAVQNAKYLSRHLGAWTIINTAVMLFIAFNWDFRLIEGITHQASQVGTGADNFITGWVFAGGVSSLVNVSKRLMKAGDAIRDAKVAEAQNGLGYP